MSCLDLDDAEIGRIAEPMMDDVMLGIARRDYALHSRHFSVDLKGTLTPAAFAEGVAAAEPARGLPGARELQCLFRRPKSFTLVWRQDFASADGETLALMTVALKGGRYFVDYFLLH